MLSYGAHTVLVTNARDLGSIVKEFKRNKISLMTGLNTLFNALLHNEAFRQCDFTSLKITVGGGMAIQQAVAEEKEVTGCPLTEGYGMTESSLSHQCQSGGWIRKNWKYWSAGIIHRNKNHG